MAVALVLVKEHVVLAAVEAAVEDVLVLVLDLVPDLAYHLLQEVINLQLENYSF